MNKKLQTQFERVAQGSPSPTCTFANALEFQFVEDAFTFDGFLKANRVGHEIVQLGLGDSQSVRVCLFFISYSKMLIERNRWTKLRDTDLRCPKPRSIWRLDDEYDETERRYISFASDKSTISSLLWIGFVGDGGGIQPDPTLGICFADEATGLFYHPDDDRGMNIYSDNPEALKKLAQSARQSPNRGEFKMKWQGPAA